MKKFIIGTLVIGVLVGWCSRDTDSSEEPVIVSQQEKKELSQTKEQRTKVIETMNKNAKEYKIKAFFKFDENDSTTIEFYRETALEAKDIHFKMSAEIYGYDISQLKEFGFNKVRIFSSQDNYTTYHLKLLI